MSVIIYVAQIIERPITHASQMQLKCNNYGTSHITFSVWIMEPCEIPYFEFKQSGHFHSLSAEKYSFDYLTGTICTISSKFMEDLPLVVPYLSVFILLNYLDYELRYSMTSAKSFHNTWCIIIPALPYYTFFNVIHLSCI